MPSPSPPARRRRRSGCGNASARSSCGRRKGEVAPELPPRTERVLHCELSDAERVVYDTVRAATLSDVVARLESGGNVMAAFEALLRLRQASCHSGLVPGQVAGYLGPRWSCCWRCWRR